MVRQPRDPESAADASVDGRRQRSVDSRRRIVRAMIELVEAGDLSPSAEQVSRQADISLRTVFRQFSDMDSLYREMTLAVEAELAPEILAPLPEGPWAGRLEAIIERRARVFERIMPFQLAAGLRLHHSQVLRERQVLLRGMLRQRLAALVPPRVRADADRFEALDLLLGFESWHRLRLEQALSVERAKSVWRLAAHALCAGH